MFDTHAAQSIELLEKQYFAAGVVFGVLAVLVASWFFGILWRKRQ